MAESLRDQLSVVYDQVTAREDEPAPEAPAAATPEGGTGEPPQSKIAEAPTDDGRPRDPKTGKFVEKKDEPAAAAKAPAAAAAKTGTPTPPPTAGTQAQPQAGAPAAKPKPARPSSWKKDYWPHWEKLTDGQPLAPEEAEALARYMNERETQFQHGVAAYNQEWNRAKPIIEAMQPFMPLLERHGIRPEAWVQSLGNAHQKLALGSPQEKLQTFAWLAQQYGLPVAALTDQAAQQEFLSKGAQGQNYQTQLPPNVLTREEADRLFQERFNAVRAQEDIQRAAADAQKYPHFEAVRETMAQLLEAKLADDLPSAYEAALRHPRHSDLWQAIQEQERTRQAEANARAEAERLAKAKGKAVSVKSATPTGAAGEKPTDRRSQLEAAYDAIAGGARV